MCPYDVDRQDGVHPHPSPLPSRERGSDSKSRLENLSKLNGRSIRRPLFSVMIGSELREGSRVPGSRPIDLVARLADRALRDAGSQSGDVDLLLQTLAVKAVDGRASVPRSDVSPSGWRQDLLVSSGWSVMMMAVLTSQFPFTGSGSLPELWLRRRSQSRNSCPWARDGWFRWPWRSIPKENLLVNRS